MNVGNRNHSAEEGPKKMVKIICQGFQEWLQNGILQKGWPYNFKKFKRKRSYWTPFLENVRQN